MNITNLSALKINKLTQAQYDRELAAGRINEDELYLTPDKSLTISDIEGLQTAIDDKATSFHNHSATEITSGTLSVAIGGTGATTFTSGAALIGAGTGAVTTRAITNNTALTYIAYNTNLMTTNSLAFWNGAYNSSNASNLTYCNRGAFGTIVTKNSGDYLSIGGGTLTGALTVSNITINVDNITSSSSALSLRVNSDATDGVTLTGNFRPVTTNKKSLGSSNHLWSQVYANTPTISTSDRNVKKDFRTFNSNENYKKLYMSLKPTVFKYIDGTSDRDHFGYISQDIEEALYKYGFTDKSFAGFCKDLRVEEIETKDGKIEEVPVLDENGNKQYDYALRYSEFIPFNTYMIQELVKENIELKEKNKGLEARVLAVESALEKLNVAS